MDSRFVFVWIILLTLILILGSHRVTSEKQQILRGDINIATIFEVQGVGSGGQCGDVKESSVIAIEAVRWYLQQYNANNSDGLQIGVSVYKTCGSLGLAGEAAVDIISSYRRSLTANSTEDFTVGVIGPEYSSETNVVSSILGSQTTKDQMLQIGFSATSTELNDRVKYPNFYRVAVEDRAQITTILKLLLDLKWNRIAIVYVNDTYGRVGAYMLQQAAEKNGICLSKMNAIEIDDSRRVDITEIRNILSDYVLDPPSIEGVVFFGTDVITKQVMQILENLPTQDAPIVILSESELNTDVFLSHSGDLLGKTKGTIAIAMQNLEVLEFVRYWESMLSNKTAMIAAVDHNPYLEDVFLQYTGCDIESASCEALTKEQIAQMSSKLFYVHYSVFAVHTLIKAIEKFNDTVCKGDCNTKEKFKSYFQPNHLVEAMDGLSVSYGGIDASFTRDTPNIQLADGETEYEVYNFRKDPDNGDEFAFVKVGYLSDDVLHLDTDKIKDYKSDGTERSYPNIRRGQCPVGSRCDKCIDSDITEINYHIPGDFYVIGIVSINNKAIPGPIGCGTVRTRHGYQMYLSMEYSLKEFQTKGWYSRYKGMFWGKSVGLIVINSCNNALEVVSKILDLHSKGLKLPNGTFLDLTGRILGYVGGQATEVSQPTAAQLTKLNFVQISYTSTNPVLSDKHLYPYFLRMISPDNLQAEAMIEIVKALGGEYIQIVYSEGGYGVGGRDSIREVAKAKKICIIQEIMVVEAETNAYFGYYEMMRRKPHAKLVIIFLRSHIVGHFLRDVNTEMTRGEFQFIGSEAWGKNRDALQYDISKGAIITAVEMDTDRDLEVYIKDQTPSIDVPNPWLLNYIQNRQQCYMSWSYDKTFPKECSADNLPTNEIDFVSDPWCIFVAKTMSAFLKGAAMFYSDKCGASSSKTLCSDYVSNPKQLFNVMRVVKMNIYGTGDILIFDEKGDGLMGYKIYNIQAGQTDRTQRVYTEVGSYSPSTGLRITLEDIEFPRDESIRSSCPSEGACLSCLGKDPPVLSTSTEEGSTDTVSMLGAFVGILIWVIIILVFVIILNWRKQRKTPNDEYITPTECLSERPSVEGRHSDKDSRNGSGHNNYITVNHVDPPPGCPNEEFVSK